MDKLEKKLRETKSNYMVIYYKKRIIDLLKSQRTALNNIRHTIYLKHGHNQNNLIPKIMADSTISEFKDLKEILGVDVILFSNNLIFLMNHIDFVLDVGHRFIIGYDNGCINGGLFYHKIFDGILQDTSLDSLFIDFNLFKFLFTKSYVFYGNKNI